jgi:hypothetical protein
VLARVIEEAGLPTTTIVLIKEQAERVKPPRALFVPFPFGFAMGNPDDPPFQRKVLEDGEAPARLLQASAARADITTAVTKDPADEVTALRGYYERWVGDHDGRTMVGLSGVPQRRWRGLVKYLESYADGQDVEYDEKPEDLAVPRFIRLAADDLKGFYMEARMCQRPDQQNNDLHQWFWTETAGGGLLSRLAERMNASEDQDLQQAAFGIAR